MTRSKRGSWRESQRDHIPHGAGQHREETDGLAAAVGLVVRRSLSRLLVEVAALCGRLAAAIDPHTQTTVHRGEEVRQTRVTQYQEDKNWVYVPKNWVYVTDDEVTDCYESCDGTLCGRIQAEREAAEQQAFIEAGRRTFAQESEHD